MRIELLFLLFTSLLTVYIVYAWLKNGKCTVKNTETNTEGFKNTPAPVDSKKKIQNPLIDLVSKLTKMSKYFTNKETWTDRIETAFMSPGDLARRYIRKQKEKEQKQT